MSAENGKVCCNCRHCIRIEDKKYNTVYCQCDIYDRYLSYAEVMDGWCRRWAKEQEDE